MNRQVLITGGAGFIGSHLCDELVASGFGVRVLDNLSEQVHLEGRRPSYLNPAVELLIGDVRDKSALSRALENVDMVVHLAAAVGVGQSMYEIAHYTSVNNLGTAMLLEALSQRPVERLVVASSMSIYGEGAYCDEEGQRIDVPSRPLAQLLEGRWELTGSKGQALRPLPTPESKHPVSSSVYALSKYDQERLCLMVGEAYRIPTVALRLFNVYGPRQALSNPYTGVMAIFASRYLNGRAPMIFEDGYQLRDFVNVHDGARAFRLALESDIASEAINIGSGKSVTVRQVAAEMAKVLHCEHIEAEVTGEYRLGDIRHCFGDIEKARTLLGYQPQVDMEQGLAELGDWLEGQIAVNKSDDASAELRRKGLLI